MLPLFIIIPLFVLLILNLPPQAAVRKLFIPAGLLLCLIQLASAVLFAFGVWDIRAIGSGTFFSLNIGIDNLSVLLLFCSSLVIFITILTSMAFVESEKNRCSLISLLLVTLAGLNGIALVRDVFSLLVFIEISSVSSFILICFNKDKDAFEGAFKYIILSSTATCLMLSSIALLVLAVGDTSFDTIKAATAGAKNSRFFLAACSLFLFGLFIKSGVVPFHGWLPDAYSSSPTYISSYLAGISTKAVGVYPLIRLAGFIFDPTENLKQIILLLGAVSILTGAFAALGQKNIKRLFAYSSISQIGYIVLSLGCFTPLGLVAAGFHFLNHAIFKSLLFVNCAALEKKAGLMDIDDYGGAAQQMPITGFTCAAAALSTAGVPPLAGFWSKLLIIVALWTSGHYNYAVIAVLASIITLAYMLVVQRKIFFGKFNEKLSGLTEASWQISLPAIILALMTILIGLLFPFVLCRLITY